MLPLQPGAVKQVLLVLDGFACQRCGIGMRKFPDLIQRHHMIDRETIGSHRIEGVRKLLIGLRRDLWYQISMCPACHAEIHRTREQEFFFPSYNANANRLSRKAADARPMMMVSKIRH